MSEAEIKKKLKALEAEKRKEAKVIKSRTAKKLQKAELEALDAKYKKLEEEIKGSLGASDEATPLSVDPVSSTVGEVSDGVQTMSLYSKSSSKKSKSQKKKEKQREKDKAREKEIEEELKNAGPSQKDVEIDALKKKFLEPNGLVLKEVKADGHCLYRAIADQIRKRESDYKDIREICANILKDNEAEYAPFAIVDCSYQEYIDNVRSSSEWGGQLEARALAQGLQRKIIIYSVEYAEPVIMGEEFTDSKPILLSFHRHYYALGEHYNSVVTL